MERRAGSGPLGFSERSSTVKEYETLTREKVDVVPFGCGMPETHLMQDWSDRMLDLILNGPTINGIKKDEVRAMLRETYGAPAQMDMAVEEMAELTKALCKIKRAQAGCEVTAAIGNVIEEMADVQIMLDQLRIIFGRSTAEAEEYKLKRLKKRLDATTAAEASHRG